MSERIPRVAILASGSGTTADAYAKAIHTNPTINSQIGAVISNKEEAGIFDKVEGWKKNYGFEVETHVINSQTHPGGNEERGQTDEESEAIPRLLKIMI